VLENVSDVSVDQISFIFRVESQGQCGQFPIRMAIPISRTLLPEVGDYRKKKRNGGDSGGHGLFVN
jgi:hypothetical protein